MQLVRMKAEDISPIALWNIELHEDEGSTPMTIDGASSIEKMACRSCRLKAGQLDISYTASNSTTRGLTSTYKLSGKWGITNAINLLTQQMLNEDQILHLDVKATNAAGKKFWESLGFVAEHVAYTRELLKTRRHV